MKYSDFYATIDQAEEMETEEFEGEGTDTREAEDESAVANDEQMDENDDGGQMEDGENTERDEGNEKQDEGEKPKVSGYHLRLRSRANTFGDDVYVWFSSLVKQLLLIPPLRGYCVVVLAIHEGQAPCSCSFLQYTFLCFQ